MSKVSHSESETDESACLDSDIEVSDEDKDNENRVDSDEEVYSNPPKRQKANRQILAESLGKTYRAWPTEQVEPIQRPSARCMNCGQWHICTFCNNWGSSRKF